MKRARLRLGKVSIRAEVADTWLRLGFGLMFRKRLGPRDGMLLKFRYSGNHAIHMWFMRFPLDVLFINQKGRIIHIRRAAPWALPFASGKPACYVLEVNAGFCRRNRIKVGDRCRNLPR